MSAAAVPVQQALSFHLPDINTFDTLVPGHNLSAVECLRTAAAGRRGLYFLSGPEGCGKSHICQALCHEHERQFPQDCFYLELKHAGSLAAEILNELSVPAGLTVIEDLELAVGDTDLELALFGLFNRWDDGGQGMLVFSSRRSSLALGFARADLSSRLGSGVSLPLVMPDGTECAEALVKHAAARGLRLSDKTAAYMVRSLNRSLPDLLGWLDELDRESFRERRSITLPFVRQHFLPSQNGGA